MKRRVILPPLMTELTYAAYLRGFARLRAELVRAELPKMARPIEQAVAFRGDALEDWSAEVFAAFERVVAGMVDRFTKLPEEVSSYARSTNRANRDQWFAIVRDYYRVDVVKAEPWLRPKLNTWERVNIDLITKMSQQSLDATRGIFLDAMQQGTTQRQLGRVVQERLGVDTRRADFIARDQVSKLNGQLTQARQEDLGVSQYKWRTSGDERVRPSHRANNGKIFRWDRPPSMTGHPGNDYRCRCTAEAIFPEVSRILGEFAGAEQGN